VGSIRTAEFSLNTRFAYGEKYVSGEFDRISVGINKYPTLELHLAYGAPNFLNSDYEYTKVVARIYRRWQLGAVGWSRTTLEGGKIFGTLPYPLLFIHSGNETYYLDDGAFNTMNFFEFISDRYIQFGAEHHFEGLFLNRIPLMRRLKWREVAAFKAVAGELDPKHFNELLLLPGMYSLRNGPFMEVSAGVENILKVLRFDIIWRLALQRSPAHGPVRATRQTLLQLLMLRAENIFKRYKRRTVVNGVSVEVEQGRDRGSARSERCWQDHQLLHDRGA
jgi:hypothetical protein